MPPPLILHWVKFNIHENTCQAATAIRTYSTAQAITITIAGGFQAGWCID